MRTTLNLDDEVFESVKQYAEHRSIALGKAASDLIRRGLAAPLQLQMKKGFFTVVLPEDAPKVTSVHVKRLLEDEI